MSDAHELIMPARARNKHAGIWRVVDVNLQGTTTLPWPYGDRRHALADGWAAAVAVAPPTTTQPQVLDLFEISTGKTHEAPIAAERGQLGLALARGRAFVCGVGPFLISVELATRRGLVRYACEGAPAGATLSSMVADGDRLIVVDDSGTSAWVFDLRDPRDANPIRHVPIGGPYARPTSHARLSVNGPFVIVRRRVNADTTFIVALDRMTLDVVGSAEYRSHGELDDDSEGDFVAHPLHEPTALAALIIDEHFYVVDPNGHGCLPLDDLMRHGVVVDGVRANPWLLHAAHPIPESRWSVLVRADRKGVGVFDFSAP
jgi:hypothetical protein